MKRKLISKALAVLLSALLLCTAGTAAFAAETSLAEAAGAAASASPLPENGGTPGTEPPAAESSGAPESGDSESSAAESSSAAPTAEPESSADDASESSASDTKTAPEGAPESSAAPAGDEVPSAENSIMLLADDKIDSFDALKKAIENAPKNGSETEIVLNGDIALTDTLTIAAGQNITLVDDGSERVISVDSAANIATMFTIEEGAALTIKTSTPERDELLTLDGENVDLVLSADDIGFITVNGAFILQGGQIVNSTIEHTSGGVVVVCGENAVFEMHGGRIADNEFRNQYGGVVRVALGATFKMSGGSIFGNDTMPESQINNAAVYIEAEGNSHFELSGGNISNNHGYFGGVFIGEPVQPDWQSIATMTMTGGSITGNTAASVFTQYDGATGGYGGGIMICGQARVTMSGGTISGNTATIGGGVAVYDLYVSIGQGLGTTLEWWKSFLPAEFTMTGGTISNNQAIYENTQDGGCGGGIYVASDNVTLKGGTIANNMAERQGGGVYVGSVPYTLRMYDAIITENTASVLGGGVWLCPTGDASNLVTNGGAIFGNTAGEGGAGDDLVAVPQDDKDHFVTLADRILGGGEAKWYEDGGVKSTTPDGYSNILGEPDGTARFDPENPGDRIENIRLSIDGLALKAVVSDAAAELAESKAQLRITGNTAPRGGGLGSNGAVIIGTPEDEWTLRVTKDWADGITDEQKKPVTVRLKIGDYALDTVTLDASNNWTKEFTQLPNPETLGELKITVVEEGEEYDASYSEITTDEGNKLLTVNITNSLKPTPSPSPSPSVTPSPVPDNTPSPSPSATPAGTPTPTPIVTPTPVPDGTPTPTPIVTPTPAPEGTPTPAPGNTPAPEASPTPQPEKPETDAPQTGDTTPYAAWLGLSALSAAALGIVLYGRKKHSR